MNLYTDGCILLFRLMTLARLHAKGDTSNPEVLAEFQEIKDAIEFDRTQAVSSFKALMEPRMRKRVILGMSIQAWSQLCGMNIMMYYIVYIMKAAQIGDELLTASIQYIINVLLTLPAILYLDRFGRRPAMLIGSFLMMSWLFISGGLQGGYGSPYHDEEDAQITWTLGPDHPNISKAVVACSYLFVASFATTWGPVSWTYVKPPTKTPFEKPHITDPHDRYPAEIFPAKIRAKAVSLATASNWFWNCILAFAVPPLLESINWKMYMIFAAFNGMALIHIFLAAPETKGRTLEEMDDVFDSGIPAWRSVPAGPTRLERLQKDIEKGQKADGTGEVETETIGRKY
jgi:MFS family permease